MRFRTSALLVLAALALSASAWAAGPTKATPVMVEPAPAAPAPKPGVRRFMVVRTFAPGVLDGLDAEGKKRVNQNNTNSDVKWIYSYANAEKTKTFCIYEGPSEKAVRDAASANKLPIDYIVEIPVVLNPR